MGEIVKDILSINQHLQQYLKNYSKEDTENFKEYEHPLLQVQNLTMISYLKELVSLILIKNNGMIISEDSIIQHSGEHLAKQNPYVSLNSKTYARLIWLLTKDRFVLEKTAGLKDKVRHQLEKILKRSTTEDLFANDAVIENVDEMDPLSFKPNPTAMVQYAQDIIPASDLNSGVYKPPRVTPVTYNAENGSKHRLSERSKERASKSRILMDLASQYDDRPEAIASGGTGFTSSDVKTKFDREMEERVAFEEENFVRLTASKEIKKQQKKIQKQGGSIRFRDEFHELGSDFKDLKGLQHAVEMDDRYGPKAKTATRKGLFIKKGESSGKKRSFKDVDDLISDMAGRRGRMPKDDYKRQKNNFLRKQERESV